MGRKHQHPLTRIGGCIRTRFLSFVCRKSLQGQVIGENESKCGTRVLLFPTIEYLPTRIDQQGQFRLCRIGKACIFLCYYPTVSSFQWPDFDVPFSLLSFSSPQCSVGYPTACGFGTSTRKQSEASGTKEPMNSTTCSTCP